ncbi:anti-CBASS protein Acb1 family protein [Candidatus Enterovibrio escicola]|uniref:anti-CBASS protein Acb1 family protein n=1 Tax=Candidatus Enterovibrio escicola TaxID=1927127 RepID=UPI001237D20D|nr:anti-CBASS Acb1 family protein [Candidatus Enterovibrio escacola]
MPKKKKLHTNAQRNDRRQVSHLAGYSAMNSMADTKRNMADAFGYSDFLTFSDYYSYAHRGIGAAIINGYPQRCFAVNPKIIDGEDDGAERELTQFEKDVEYFAEELHLWQRFQECYRLNRIGNYAAIVPTFAESTQSELQSELSPIRGAKNVLRFTPYNQAQAVAATDQVIDDFSSPLLGSPKYFDIRPDALGDRNLAASYEYRLHHSRVFVMAEGANDGSIFGIPALEAPFNAIFDASKVRGAGAEGYYKNAKQRTVMSAKDAESARLMAAKSDVIDARIDDFEAGFNSMLKLSGVDVSSLQTSIADPTGAWTIAMNEVCATTGYPLTVLIGFQSGERSSTENNRDFNTNLQAKCNNFLTPTIKQFFKWLIKHGAMTPPSSGKITVVWPDFLEPSTSDKLASAKIAVDTNKTAYDCNMEPVYTVGEIRELAGYDPEIEEQDIFGEGDEALDDENTSD